ncbi:hypothetical protein CBR_g40186 [Chara braunii]|uniref:NET domain-containing protein n=1 Tax=Chara braunii TaxID=69332 RepID=A0A388LT86_CHABU|nr:hypothetical protein CBR_g40186 [Chara braunii]|eukprot:GBG85548.1 hypothetical protein CBR_g40186 [Chara braunii]
MQQGRGGMGVAGGGRGGRGVATTERSRGVSRGVRPPLSRKELGTGVSGGVAAGVAAYGGMDKKMMVGAAQQYMNDRARVGAKNRGALEVDNFRNLEAVTVGGSGGALKRKREEGAHPYAERVVDNPRGYSSGGDLHLPGCAEAVRSGGGIDNMLSQPVLVAGSGPGSGSHPGQGLSSLKGVQYYAGDNKGEGSGMGRAGAKGWSHIPPLRGVSQGKQNVSSAGNPGLKIDEDEHRQADRRGEQAGMHPVRLGNKVLSDGSEEKLPSDGSSSQGLLDGGELSSLPGLSSSHAKRLGHEGGGGEHHRHMSGGGGSIAASRASRGEVLSPSKGVGGELSSDYVTANRKGEGGGGADPSAERRRRFGNPFAYFGMRELSFKERMVLIENIQTLPEDRRLKVMDIISCRNPNAAEGREEIDLDFVNLLDVETLWDLNRFVNNWVKKRKNKLMKQMKSMEMSAETQPLSWTLKRIVASINGGRWDGERMPWFLLLLQVGGRVIESWKHHYGFYTYVPYRRYRDLHLQMGGGGCIPLAAVISSQASLLAAVPQKEVVSIPSPSCFKEQPRL